MSKEARDMVWKHSKQEGTALIVMLALAEFANAECVAWPSIEALSEKVRRRPRQVQYILRQLVESEELKVVGNVAVGRGNTTRYLVQCAAPFSEEKGAVDCTLSTEEMVQHVAPFTAPFTEEKVQSSAEKVQSSVIKGAIAIAPEPIEPKNREERARACEEARPATPAELYEALRELCKLPEQPSARAGYALQDAASKLEANGRTVADLYAIARWFSTEHWQGKTPVPAQLVDLWPQFEAWRAARRPKPRKLTPVEPLPEPIDYAARAAARTEPVTPVGPILPNGQRAAAVPVRRNGDRK